MSSSSKKFSRRFFAKGLFAEASSLSVEFLRSFNDPDRPTDLVEKDSQEEIFVEKPSREEAPVGVVSRTRPSKEIL